MPRKPRAFCIEPHCPERADKGSRCDACYRKRMRARPTAAQRGYGRRHQILREKFLKYHPYCAGFQKTCHELADTLDHIVPLAQGGEDDYSNYQALCRSCHSRKTMVKDGGPRMTKPI